LITCADPLRLFIYEEGLARFSTVEYEEPSKENLKEVYMHLTNYAINKHNPDFVRNRSIMHDNVGHKQSMSAVMKQLEKAGVDVDQVWTDI
jgi:tubulin polyglutamylase TTLL6/13